MSFAVRFAVIVPLVLLGSSAQAQEVEVATNLVCDTQAQVERFVALYDEDPQDAADAVNLEVHNPNACAVSTMAFIRGPLLATARNKDRAFQIAPIIVVGVVTPTGIQPTTPAAFFSMFEVDELRA